MKSIIVPTDFSKASRNATQFAVSLASYFDADVTLINVIPPAIMADDSVLAFVMTTQAELLENSKGLMEKEVKALSKKYSGKISGLVLEGLATESILEISEEKDADLIVMGTKGKGKSNAVFGSTTISVIRKSTLPVFVIPEKAVFTPIRTITLAADFRSETELEHYTRLMRISEKFDSKIYILNVQKNSDALTSEMAIGKMKTNVAFSNRKHQFLTIYDDKVTDGIQKFINAGNTDILAMVAHKHSIFERLFGKVHTRDMSYQTTVPLLILQSK